MNIKMNIKINIIKRETETQRHRDTETQRHRETETHRDTET
jgi:hypothetical protein